MCSGFLSSDQLYACAQYTPIACMMNSQCIKNCSSLECYRGEETNPFYTIVVPKNIGQENAKNLCVFSNSNIYTNNIS